MGCCLSTTNEPPSSAPKPKHPKTESRAPPPSTEEETVKEVLSETPKPKPVEMGSEDVKETDFSGKDEKNDILENKKQQYSISMAYTNNEESMSEVSEICSLSLSESLSTTTTTNITETRREVNEEVHKSPAKTTPRNREYYGVRRDRVVGQSPTRRSDQSPIKRNTSGSARMVQSRREESSQPTAIYGSRSEPIKRDPGESSGRRSRSPATTRSAAVGRSPSSRRTNGSPSRVRSDRADCGGGGYGRKVVENRNTEGSCKWPRNNSSHINNKKNNGSNISENESLENPLVSLECFIFL